MGPPAALTITAMRSHPYDLLKDPAKTTITAPGGIALGYGPGPGLGNAIFWNRVGSLFSCYRPAVARLTLFTAADPHRPVALSCEQAAWEPNLVTARYLAEGLVLREERTALKGGLRSTLTLQSTAAEAREWVLFFHGQVEQWPFFDYQASLPEPRVSCEADPAKGMLILTQPHPHHGLPQLNSVQTVTLDRPFDVCGFGQNEGDLACLWHDHGCLASLRMRLGQVGGRFVRMDEQHPGFSHRHPLYYFAVRVRLEPGQSETLSVGAQYRTDDPGGMLENALEGTTRAEWRHYLEEEVPQLECSDADLTRYWYYVYYILRANRTAPGAHVPHPFTAPSKYLYWGPWIWDGYFHVLGEMWLGDPEVARDTIRAVLAMRFPSGYIPVCSGSQYRMCFHDQAEGYTCPGGGGYASYVPSNLKLYRAGKHPYEAELGYLDGSPAPGKDHGKHSMTRFIHNEKTQTPLITVAAWHFVQLRDDRDFAREVLPALWDYEQWLWRRRCDRKGRFILWHGDESGWDDSTRHYPVPAKPFDVQVHSLLHRVALLRLAELAGGAEWQAELEERIDLTRRSLETYWSKRRSWYCDLSGVGGDQTKGKRRRQIAASGLFALLVEQSDRTVLACLKSLTSAQSFGTAFPIPTLATAEPDYAPHGWGWNGPAWLQVNYFAITGLLAARQYEAAFSLWERTRALIIRDGRPHSYELYDPELGTGIGCPDYSWQAMINHLLIRHFAGVGHRQGELKPALPPGLDHFHLSRLPGWLSEIELKRQKYTVIIRTRHPQPVGLELDLAGMGEFKSVTANGTEMVLGEDGCLTAAGGGTSSLTWEIIGLCH